MAEHNKKTPKKKEPAKKKIIRDRARESKMETLFLAWHHGDHAAYEQLLQIAREEDKELTESDLVHPYDTDKFVARKYLHVRNIQQKPCDCILEPGLSLEELKDWKEQFLILNAFYPPTEYLALLHYCNGCDYIGKQIQGLGTRFADLNAMKQYTWWTPSLLKTPALEFAMRLSFDEGVYHYIYLPAERIYGVYFVDGSDFQYCGNRWELYASLWEALKDMPCDE